MPSSDKLVHSIAGGWAIWCPACGCGHCMIEGRWTYNGDPDKPTFNPSLLVRGVVPITDEEADRIMAGENIEPKPLVCHSFIRDGKIQYLGDCTHAMAGKTVDMEAF